jgi:pimeloyl-ACP methyl ester carboxylesterase
MRIPFPFSTRAPRGVQALLLGMALLLSSWVSQAASRQYTVATPDGVTLAVQEQGPADAPAIVFVHGLLGSRLDWDAQLSSPALADFRLITYDLRGHGLSGKPPQAEAYREGLRWAVDLATVLKASKAGRATLVGWSLGGVVISNYLARYGDAGLAGVVYVDGVIELKPELILPHPAVYRDLVADDLGTHLDAIATFLRLCFATPPSAPVFERLLANAAMASWDMQRAVQGISVDLAGLRAIKQPVLLLYGGRDALVDTPATLARARQIQPQAQTLLYPQAGHAPFLEEAERFNRDLADFVARAQPPR